MLENTTLCSSNFRKDANIFCLFNIDLLSGINFNILKIYKYDKILLVLSKKDPTFVALQLYN